MTFEESLQHEIDAMILLSDVYGWRTLKTPRYARVDGIVTNYDGDMLAVYEFKSRELTLDELTTMGTYLVTHQKIQDGCDAARTLGVGLGDPGGEGEDGRGAGRPDPLRARIARAAARRAAGRNHQQRNRAGRQLLHRLIPLGRVMRRRRAGYDASMTARRKRDDNRPTTE